MDLEGIYLLILFNTEDRPHFIFPNYGGSRDFLISVDEGQGMDYHAGWFWFEEENDLVCLGDYHGHGIENYADEGNCDSSDGSCCFEYTSDKIIFDGKELLRR